MGAPGHNTVFGTTGRLLFRHPADNFNLAKVFVIGGVSHTELEFACATHLFGAVNRGVERLGLSAGTWEWCGDSGAVIIFVYDAGTDTHVKLGECRGLWVVGEPSPSVHACSAEGACGVRELRFVNVDVIVGVVVLWVAVDDVAFGVLNATLATIAVGSACMSLKVAFYVRFSDVFL